MDQKVSHILGEIQKHEAKYNRAKNQIQGLSHDLKTLVVQVDANKEQAADRVKSIEDLTLGVMQLKEQHQALLAENQRLQDSLRVSEQYLERFRHFCEIH